MASAGALASLEQKGFFTFSRLPHFFLKIKLRNACGQITINFFSFSSCFFFSFSEKGLENSRHFEFSPIKYPKGNKNEFEIRVKTTRARIFYIFMMSPSIKSNLNNTFFFFFFFCYFGSSKFSFIRKFPPCFLVFFFSLSYVIGKPVLFDVVVSIYF